METKNLDIQQAVEWEKFNKTLYTFDEFKTELAANHISDVFSDTKIKQDKQKYIFTINGENRFAIDGETNLISWIQKFYEEQWAKESRKAEEKVLIRIEGLKLEYIKSKTQDELNILKKDITKVENSIEKATDIENVKYKLERLITFFEQEKSLSNQNIWWFLGREYNRKDRWLRKINKTEIKWRLKELNKIKNQIERLEKNTDKKYGELKMDDVNDMNMKMTLKQFNDTIEDLGKEAPNFILTRNQIVVGEGDTAPYFEIIGYDKSDAKKLNRSLKKINNEYAILNELKLTGAKRQELSQDLQDLEEYLNNVINNPDTFKPSEHPFIPRHTKDFFALMETKPTPEQYKEMNKEAEITPETNSSTVPLGSWVVIETNNRWREYAGSPYGDTKEAFERWWIAGVLKYGLDQTNMKPNQKQFWWGVGNIAMIGWLAFVGWKMLKSAFSLFTKDGRSEKNLGKNLARLGIPTALIMWSQMYSGEWPLKLFTWGALTNKLANIFGWNNTTESTGGIENQTLQDQETRIRYKEGFLWATALFSGLNYGEMKQFLIKKGDQIKIDPDKYDTLLEMFKNWSKKNEAAASFISSIGKDDERHVLDLGLTGMGISREEIENDNNKDKKFDKIAIESIVRLSSVTEFMDKEWYNKINSETQYLVDEYIRNDNDANSLEELKARGDVFYKEIETKDATGLAPKIKEWANNDTEKEEELLLAINSFHEQMPNAEKKIELSGTRPMITFGTYEQSTTINLENKELIGFTPKRFSSYLEVLKAANLTNRIKEICKDKQAVSDKPFYLSAGRDITFDNAKLFSTDFDTEIMTAGRWGSLKKVSQTLEKNKQAYCDYLNANKFWKERPAT